MISALSAFCGSRCQKLPTVISCIGSLLTSPKVVRDKLQGKCAQGRFQSTKLLLIVAHRVFWQSSALTSSVSSQKSEKTLYWQRLQCHNNSSLIIAGGGKILFHPRWGETKGECFFEAQTGFLGVNYRARPMRTVGLVRVCSDYSNKSGAFLSRARSYQALPEDWGLFLTLGLCWKLFLRRTWAFMAAVDTFWIASTCVFDSAAPACVAEGKRGFPKIWVEKLLCLLCSALFCCAAVSWKWLNDQISKGRDFVWGWGQAPYMQTNFNSYVCIRYHLKSQSSIWFRNNPGFSVFWSILKAEKKKTLQQVMFGA